MENNGYLRGSHLQVESFPRPGLHDSRTLAAVLSTTRRGQIWAETPTKQVMLYISLEELKRTSTFVHEPACPSE
ncbi:hypothetical protein DPMN_174804 [Dreissena polymorpha]|uniref:Uncharacterized protein n=1 Tax=Dreissena polymorpha TaxID=45954 RepID=A0A9D4E620_DREPO|nr:hypothetical protein DPMN_174804 [Dreissena polymorpha]